MIDDGIKALIPLDRVDNAGVADTDEVTEVVLVAFYQHLSSPNLTDTSRRIEGAPNFRRIHMVHP